MKSPQTVFPVAGNGDKTITPSPGEEDGRQAGSRAAPAAGAVAIAAGLGCDRGTPFATVNQVLDEALSLAGVAPSQLAVLATIEAKSDEAAFLELASARGLPLRFFSTPELAAVEVPNPSETVRRYMGTPSVSEAAALLAANASAEALVVEKHKLRGPDGRNATVSLARFPE